MAQVCKTCGSEEVARLGWVNANTGELIEGYECDLEWCFGECKSQTKIIDTSDIPLEQG